MELRDLPSVDQLARTLQPDGWVRLLTIEVARRAINEAREAIRAGGETDPAAIANAELQRLRRLRPTRVINATGVLLNTNLGRAPLHPVAASAAAEAHHSYSNVEFDLTTGTRGGRGSYVAELIRRLTGSEDALVVNNNAGALYLALTALARERQVIVSRGELIEIGGSFRLPELMAAAGVWLREVGTTNRTRLADYESAIGADTGLIVKVHPSNYRVVGFYEDAAYRELASLAHGHYLPLVADIGSGLLDAAVPWIEGPPPTWLADEPAVRQTLDAGADLVLFSGDKLLGGPQAGIVAGSDELIYRMRRHPVARALRCDGATLAALATTLELYADDRGGEVPFWAMAAIPAEELGARSRACLAEAAVPGEVIEDASVVGAGSVPGQTIPSPVIRVKTDDLDGAWHRLLASPTAVAARRHEGALLVDLRAVDDGDDSLVAKLLAVACRS